MSKDPAVLFYTSDFLSGTTFFTDEETGQYIRLLCHQHQLGHIPFGHMTKSLSSPSSPVWLKFDKDDAGLYYNIRMDLEKEKRISYCKSRTNNKEGHNQYTKNVGHTTLHMTGHMTGHMENDNRVEISPIDTSNTTTPNNTSKTLSTIFEDVWSKYPKRVGKKDALRHFNASVKNENDVDNLWVALGNYLKSERVYNGFIQNGGTFFNNWRDWIDHKEDVCPKCKGKGKYTSVTGYDSVCTCPKGNNK